MQDKLFSETLGTGPNLVLLHGWGVHSGFWKPILSQLTQQFTVTMIDLPGFGRSAEINTAYDLPSIAQLVLSVAPNKATWLGWSFGGVVASYIANLAPNRIERLICVASSPKFIKTAGWPGVKISLFDRLMTALEGATEEALTRFLSLQFKNTAISRRNLLKLRDEVYEYGAPPIEALRSGLEIIRSVDLRDQLATIKKPTLFILGKRDLLVPSAIAPRIREILINGEIQVLQQACHAPFLSSTGDFMQLLTDYTKMPMEERLAV